MSWDANDVALLKSLWADGHSAGQIASRLGLSRNAVSAKLKRLGHKRGHKPPTASPKIVSVPTRKPRLAAACAMSVDTVVSKPRVARSNTVKSKTFKSKTVKSKAARRSRATVKPAREFSKHELLAMLADAVRNTGDRTRQARARRDS